jgi:hypothetical protein
VSEEVSADEISTEAISTPVLPAAEATTVDDLL